MTNQPLPTEERNSKLTRLPTFEEIDQLVKETIAGGMCSLLCNEYQAAAELYEDAPPKSRPAILARMKALATEMKNLHCPGCNLQ